MRREGDYPHWGKSPHGAATGAPGQAQGAAAGCDRGLIARWSVARATVVARQDVDGRGKVMRRRGMGHSRGQAPQQQTGQEQGQEPASGVMGSM